jgi:hypothetical protein
MIYVWRDGRFRDPKSGEPMHVPDNASICTPTVISDIPEYASPIDGRLISSRSARREDLKRHNCVDGRDFPSLSDGKFRNKGFCRKRGLPYQ